MLTELATIQCTSNDLGTGSYACTWQSDKGWYVSFRRV